MEVHRFKSYLTNKLFQFTINFTNMTFENLVKKIQAQFAVMCATGRLFRVALPEKVDAKGRIISTGAQLWGLYLSTFKEHKIWREVSEHDCVEDKNFFHRYANVVALTSDNQLLTLFDINGDLGEYSDSVAAVANAIRTNAKSFTKFFESYSDLQKMGKEEDRGLLTDTQATYLLGVEPNVHTYLYDSTKVAIKDIPNYDKKYDAKGLPQMTYTYSSFHLELPREFVDFSDKSAGELQNEFTSCLTAFTKAMNNISPLALEAFINKFDIKLYMFDEYVGRFDKFLALSEEFAAVEISKSSIWLVNKVIELNTVPNSEDPTKSSYLSNWFSGNEGEMYVAYQNKEYSSDEAFVNAWNKRQNEKYGSNKPVTEAQKAEAQKVLEEGNWVTALQRRFAATTDIDVSQIRFNSKSTNNTYKPATIFDVVGVPKTESTSGTVLETDFENAPKITIAEFYKLLPNFSSLEVLVSNRLAENFMVLITAINAACKGLLDWNNHFSITYISNRARKSVSAIAHKIKAVGGLTEGESLVRLNWNQAGKEGKDDSDLDLHCRIGNRDHIYHGQKQGRANSGGVLDVDILHPLQSFNTKYEGIENIAFKSLTVKDSYTYSVHNFSNRGSKGFMVELQIFNEMFTYNYGPVRQSEEIKVVTVNYLGDGKYTLIHHLPPTESSTLQETSQTIWGIETNKFHKVNLSCYSPNHWGDNASKSLEYLFFIQDCKPDTAVKTFHVDHLNTDLMSKPVRRALNLFADYTKISANKDTSALAGLGFNSTVKDNLIVKAVENGKTKVFNIQF